jgi:hypothetical protein
VHFQLTAPRTHYPARIQQYALSTSLIPICDSSPIDTSRSAASCLGATDTSPNMSNSKKVGLLTLDCDKGLFLFTHQRHKSAPPQKVPPRWRPRKGNHRMSPSGCAPRFPASPYPPQRPRHYTHSCSCLKALNPPELAVSFLMSPPTVPQVSLQT